MDSQGIEVSAISKRSGGPRLGGWGATLLAGALIALIGAVVIWLGLTGRLADLKHADLPFHAYPPAGYAYNPFDPSNKDDLINIAEADRVKNDLLVDGSTELAAFSTGDGSRLGDGVTGAALAKLEQVLADNNRSGITQIDANKLESIVVGRLPDPAIPSITWCVQEKGTGTITSYRKGSSQPVGSRQIRFDSKFWLVRRSGRYLIIDSLISSTYQ
jgi:hypothetical protein